jgi:hypothetical protein
MSKVHNYVPLMYLRKTKVHSDIGIPKPKTRQSCTLCTIEGIIFYIILLYNSLFKGT